MPYGIDTVSLIAFVFLVILPKYAETGSWKQGFALGLVACVGSGVVELLGAFATLEARFMKYPG